MKTKQDRAEPLAPDDRRRAIIDAVTPLILERGPAITTRDIAQAAGIAEGTIFRVFPDKTSVIVGAIRGGMDPTLVCDALSSIPSTLPMERQIEEAVQVLFAWSDRVVALFGALRSLGHAEDHRPTGGREFVKRARSMIVEGLTQLLERHREHLRVDPRRAAIALQGFVLAAAHPMAGAEHRLEASEIVDMLLRGIARPESKR